MEIMTALVVSTGHVTEEEDRAIKAGHPPGELHSPLMWDYGYMFYIGDDEESFDTDGLSVGMLGAIRYARSHGLEWVRFDCDGPTLDGVETYHW